MEDAKKVIKVIKGHQLSIYSKIQSKKGLTQFDEILEVSDGIIIGRGYLGLSLDEIEDVVFVQTYIINKCNAVGKPVILQTHILESMISRLRPTRSEVCDIAHAVEEGIDAMILTAETATGPFFAEAIAHMSKIFFETEANLEYVKKYQKQ